MDTKLSVLETKVQHQSEELKEFSGRIHDLCRLLKGNGTDNEGILGLVRRIESEVRLLTKRTEAEDRDRQADRRAWRNSSINHAMTIVFGLVAFFFALRNGPGNNSQAQSIYTDSPHRIPTDWIQRRGYWTTLDIAQAFGVSDTVIRRKIKEGSIPAHKGSNGDWQIPFDYVELSPGSYNNDGETP